MRRADPLEPRLFLGWYVEGTNRLAQTPSTEPLPVSVFPLFPTSGGKNPKDPWDDSLIVESSCVVSVVQEVGEQFVHHNFQRSDIPRAENAAQDGSNDSSSTPSTADRDGTSSSCERARFRGSAESEWNSLLTSIILSAKHVHNGEIVHTAHYGYCPSHVRLGSTTDELEARRPTRSSQSAWRSSVIQIPEVDDRFGPGRAYRDDVEGTVMRCSLSQRVLLSKHNYSRSQCFTTDWLAAC